MNVLGRSWYDYLNPFVDVEVTKNAVEDFSTSIGHGAAQIVRSGVGLVSSTESLNPLSRFFQSGAGQGIPSVPDKPLVATHSSTPSYTPLLLAGGGLLLVAVLLKKKKRRK